jgi:hypothetical protein
VPIPEGVSVTVLPVPLIVPPVAVQVTAELKLPVTVTVAVTCAVCVVVMAFGVVVTVTEVIVTGIAATVTANGKDVLLVSLIDAAVIFAAPGAFAVTRPLAVSTDTIAALSEAKVQPSLLGVPSLIVTVHVA